VGSIRLLVVRCPKCGNLQRTQPKKRDSRKKCVYCARTFLVKRSLVIIEGGRKTHAMQTKEGGLEATFK